jgi:poly-gamma-glutamate synthesis protein (capsule biosynthesis protein)
MLTRQVGQVIAAHRDPAWPFRQIAADFARADLAFVNLESPFTDQGKPTTSGMVFRADPANVAGLDLAGIDVVSFANNHSRDAHATRSPRHPRSARKKQNRRRRRRP